MPERFGDAGAADPRRAAQPSAALPPVAEAIAALAPPVPPAPHRLLPPEELPAVIETARAVAEVHARYPRDERERYARPRVESDHPAASDRSLRRRHARYDRATRAGRAEDGS